MSFQIKVRLYLMMFFQFFVWGGWFVTNGTFLNTIGFSGTNIGLAYMMNNIGAIISPFFIGMIADRFFPSQIVLGILHILGGLIMFYAAGAGAHLSAATLIMVLLLYNVCYMPTLALVNAVSFNQMKDPAREFPGVRVWGTIGWIVAGLAITFVLAPMIPNVEKTAIPMKMAAAISMLLGLYSFTLPNTPPKNRGKKVSVGDILGVKALSMLKEPSFAVFVLCSFLISIPLAFYYNFTNMFFNDTGMQGVAGKMTMGQMSEMIFMFCMPLLFVRLGVKKMLLFGMLAWVLRYVLFAMGNNESMVWMFYLGIILHGICYDFFFVTGQIYTDARAGSDIRASAQGFITLVTYGLGLAVGSFTSGKIVDAFTSAGVRNWSAIWWIPACFALAVALLFAVTFKNGRTSPATKQS